MQERRRDKRLELEVRVQLEQLDEGDLTTIKFVHVDVTDISKRGIGFDCKQKLQIGTYYDTRIQIWTKEIVNCVVEIVRSEEHEDGSFHYGGVFIGLLEQDALKIDIYQMFQESK